MSHKHLGKKYKDKITKFSGVCTGFCEYLTGCNQLLIQPESEKDSRWIDAQRLEQVGKSQVSLDNSKSPGFDKQAPIR